MPVSDEDLDLERGLVAAESAERGGATASNARDDHRRYRGFFGALLKTVEISPGQEEVQMAQEIRNLVGVKFDSANIQHAADLKMLWGMLFPEEGGEGMRGMRDHKRKGGGGAEEGEGHDYSWEGLK